MGVLVAFLVLWLVEIRQITFWLGYIHPTMPIHKFTLTLSSTYIRYFLYLKIMLYYKLLQKIINFSDSFIVKQILVLPKTRCHDNFSWICKNTVLFDVNKDLVELMRSDGIYRGSVSRVEEISNIQSNNKHWCGCKFEFKI